MNDILEILKDYLPTILGSLTAVASAVAAFLVTKYNRKKADLERDRLALAKSNGYYIETKDGKTYPLCEVTFKKSNGDIDNDLDGNKD